MVPSYKGCLIQSWWYTTQDGHICTRAWGVGGEGAHGPPPPLQRQVRLDMLQSIYLAQGKNGYVTLASFLMSVSLLLSLPSTVLPVICHCSFILIHHVSQTCLPQIVGVADFLHICAEYYLGPLTFKMVPCTCYI